MDLSRELHLYIHVTIIIQIFSNSLLVNKSSLRTTGHQYIDRTVAHARSPVGGVALLMQHCTRHRHLLNQREARQPGKYCLSFFSHGPVPRTQHKHRTSHSTQLSLPPDHTRLVQSSSGGKRLWSVPPPRLQSVPNHQQRERFPLCYLHKKRKLPA